MITPKLLEGKKKNARERSFIVLVQEFKPRVIHCGTNFAVILVFGNAVTYVYILQYVFENFVKWKLVLCL